MQNIIEQGCSKTSLQLCNNDYTEYLHTAMISSYSYAVKNFEVWSITGHAKFKVNLVGRRAGPWGTAIQGQHTIEV